jgi:hypothetical protein
MAETLETALSGMPADLQLRRRAEAVGNGLQSSVATLIQQLQGKGLRDQKALQGALQLSQSVATRW